MKGSTQKPSLLLPQGSREIKTGKREQFNKVQKEESYEHILAYVSPILLCLQNTLAAKGLDLSQKCSNWWSESQQ